VTGRLGDAEKPTKEISVSPRLPVSQSALSKWRNAILGTLLVLSGLAAALVTILARETNNYVLAAAAATLSLVSAALMLIFIVPPLARSARLEVNRFDLPITVTTGGWIFVLILLVVGFAAWNTGNNLLFVERGLPTALVPNRDVGVMLHGKILDGVLAYQAGSTNDC